jgi:hypothetical protein
MIIALRESKLFTHDPDKRFAWEYDVPQGLWKEMWRRYQLLDYTARDLCDLYYVKTGKVMSPRTVNRWVWRSEVYMMAKPVIEKGAQHVTSEFFGRHEMDVVKELTKNIRVSVRHAPRALP